MNISVALFGVSLGMLVLSLMLLVIFGQVTVRKLRRNPETRHELGLELMSGYDILNVAGALALPRWVNRKLRNSQISFLYANAEILDKHTNKFDRVLAIIFYVPWVISILSLITLMLLELFGLFE